MRVFVTGMGIVSALGKSKEAQLRALRSGKSGLKKAQYLQSKYSNKMPFGEVPFSNEWLKKTLPEVKHKGFTRTDLLAFLAFKEAITESEISKKDLQSYRTAFISASTVGGMCETDAFYSDANLQSKGTEYVDSYSAGVHSLQIALHYGIKGNVSNLNTACSSSANAILMGGKLIKTGMATRAIVGGTDSLAKFTVNGFNALQILSEKPCKPFDKKRNGLNLGEGAAYLILEAENICQNKNKIAELTGYGNANDAFHPSALSEKAIGVIKTIKQALKTANLTPKNIDYINTHGTATPNNDAIELKGIDAVFNGKIPAYNSTKCYTGHTLAAAGAIEAVFSILSLQNNELYPLLQLQTFLDSQYRKPILKYEKVKNIQHVLSNSFGFAGNCSSLIFSQP